MDEWPVSNRLTHHLIWGNEGSCSCFLVTVASAKFLQFSLYIVLLKVTHTVNVLK